MMDKSDRAYKTIGEVAKILDLKVNKKGSLPTHIIRFWETQFKQIRPKILNSNRRYYDEETIIVLKKVKFLLKDQGMTIKGVKKILKSNINNLDNMTLSINLWDSSLVGSVEKALLESNLGATPQIEGSNVLLKFPELTSERRKELVKIVSEIAEKYKTFVELVIRECAIKQLFIGTCASYVLKNTGKSDKEIMNG